MKIDVLDSGYVEFIEAWGSGEYGLAGQSHYGDFEVGIIEAARQSTQGSFRGWMEDGRLLQFLYQNRHDTPFEFAGMVIEVQAPIFVFREWHRHRTQSYNEMSARYAPLPDLYYEPTAEHIQLRATKAAAETRNKQAGATGELDLDAIAEWHRRDHYLSEVLEQHYKTGLSIGVPKELARKKMPVDHYSRMRASANLRNWLAFMTLRCDQCAQWEIQQYANAVSEIIREVFPQTHILWTNGRD